MQLVGAAALRDWVLEEQILRIVRDQDVMSPAEVQKDFVLQSFDYAMQHSLSKHPLYKLL